MSVPPKALCQALRASLAGEPAASGPTEVAPEPKAYPGASGQEGMRDVASAGTHRRLCGGPGPERPRDRRPP
jgi:hypothetical protein